jgi:hypothetical protein
MPFAEVVACISPQAVSADKSSVESKQVGVMSFVRIRQTLFQHRNIIDSCLSFARFSKAEIFDNCFEACREKNE